MEGSMKNKLMKKFNLNKEEVSKLILTYARNHNGKVNFEDITNDVENITESMVYELGNIYKDYDVKHELLDCGKDRQQDAMNYLLNDDLREVAFSYLFNNYYLNVETWVKTFYHATQSKLLKKLEGDIDSYREFVNGLQYQNIYKVANTYGIEDKVVEFLAKNGKLKDFQKFMTKVEPIRNSSKTERKGCPHDLCEKIFKSIQKEMQESGKISFNKKNIMRGLSSIHRNKNLTEEEKEQLQDLYITNSLRGGRDEFFIELSRKEELSDFDTLNEYLKMNLDTDWKQKEEYLTRVALPEMEASMKNAYNNLVTKLKEELKEKDLTYSEVIELIRESNLSQENQNYLQINQNEEANEIKLTIKVPHPIIRGEEMEVNIDGTELKQIIDELNERFMKEANEKIEEFAEKGIGEVKIVVENWNAERNFRFNDEFNKDRTVGVLNEDEDYPPYLAWPKRDFSRLQVKLPYYIISDGLLYDELKTATMTEEQINKFNREKNKEEIQSRKSDFRGAADFTVDGKTCHIDDFPRYVVYGHVKNIYTGIWFGKEDEKYSSDKIQITGDWNDFSENFIYGAATNLDIANFIRNNPNRFMKMYNEYSKTDKEFLLSKFLREMMKMEPESKLTERIALEENKLADDAFIKEIEKMATEKEGLVKKEEAALDLLTNYEDLESRKNVNIFENK